ncbi:MAG: carboxypeptidase-like regulatory domain-containing protein [Bacteroidota bacterium]
METYRRYFVFIFCIILSLSLFSQTSFCISGRVNDADSQQILSKVRVTIWELQLGTYTDDEGKFTLDLPAGEYTFGFTHNAYKKQFLKVNVASDAFIPITLYPKKAASSFSLFQSGTATQSSVSAPVRLINDLGEIFFHKIWN